MLQVCRLSNESGASTAICDDNDLATGGRLSTDDGHYLMSQKRDDGWIPFVIDNTDFTIQAFAVCLSVYLGLK